MPEPETGGIFTDVTPRSRPGARRYRTPFWQVYVVLYLLRHRRWIGEPPSKRLARARAAAGRRVRRR
jgi:hypothetical protein